MYSSPMNCLPGAGLVEVERCPACRAKVVTRQPGEIMIRNAILRVDAPTGRVTAKCPRCKAWLEVPLRYVAR